MTTGLSEDNRQGYTRVYAKVGIVDEGGGIDEQIEAYRNCLEQNMQEKSKDIKIVTRVVSVKKIRVHQLISSLAKVV
ncbi:MAG: hypothetical protein LBU27_00810 [Candidatus Peribacteria bacterium]|nr:hypothetical protein [Candidatus Peribacteria bacterium]